MGKSRWLGILKVAGLSFVRHQEDTIALPFWQLAKELAVPKHALWFSQHTFVNRKLEKGFIKGQDRMLVEKLDSNRGQSQNLVSPGSDALLSPAVLLRSDLRDSLCRRHPPVVLLSSAWTKLSIATLLASNRLWPNLAAAKEM